MNLNIVDGAKNRTTPTPSKKKNKQETSINYNNICFLKYLNSCIHSNVVGGGLSE